MKTGYISTVDRTKAVNILVVDDDRSAQRVLSDGLSRQGFTVTVERDAQWALRTFEKREFDVLLLDVVLPGMTGLELAKVLRQTPKGKRVPIVFISGAYTQDTHESEMKSRYGAFALLRKPIHLHDLYDVLKDILDDAYPTPKAQRKELPPPPPERDDDEDSERTPMATPTDTTEAIEVDTQKSAKRPALGPSISGSLDQKPFAQVLAEMYRWKASGALLLNRANVKKIVYFQEGRPTFVKSNRLAECLGQIMVAEKMISEAECEESVKRMKKSSRLQGTTLIEMGSISPHNLQYALTLQLQTKLLDVFRWKEGHYQFNPQAALPAENINVDMTTAQIIYEGIRRHGDLSVLAAWAKEHANEYVTVSSDPMLVMQDIRAGEEELALLENVTGTQTLETILSKAEMTENEALQLLYALDRAQMTELTKTATKNKSMGALMKEAQERSLSAQQNTEKHAQPPKLPAISVPKLAPRAPKKKERENDLFPELDDDYTGPGEDAVMRERLASELQTFRGQNYLEMLKLDASCTKDEVKNAYFVVAKGYHPDHHFASASNDVKAIAQEIYDLLTTAHDVLVDKDEREKYIKALSYSPSGSRENETDEVSKMLAAEGRFQSGQAYYRKREFEAALKQFDEAISMCPKEAEYVAYRAWTRYLVHAKETDAVKQAVSQLEDAISLGPRVDKGYLFLAYVHKANGRPDKAEKLFEKAIVCNPNCTEALRELRLLGKN